MRYNKVGDKILVKEDKWIENKIILGKEGENKIQKKWLITQNIIKVIN